MQGYNVQTAVNENQIALAGEITVETIDFGQLSPMTDATVRELEAAGVSDRPSVVLADAGYWNEQHMDDDCISLCDLAAFARQPLVEAALSVRASRVAQFVR